MAGAAPAAKQQPRKVCTGTLENIETPTVSASNNYYLAKFKLKGVEGMGAYGMFLYRPEWFGKDFTPAIYAISNDPKASDAEKKAASSMEFVYAKNMCSGDKNRVSILEGLCGSVKRYEELCRELEALPNAADTEAVGTLLSSFLLNGDTLGYGLKQKSELTEYVDADGVTKKTRLLGNNFEIDFMFYNNTRQRESLIKQAISQNAKAVAASKPLAVTVAFA